MTLQIDGVSYYTAKELSQMCEPKRSVQTIMRYTKLLRIKPKKQRSNRRNLFTEKQKDKVLEHANGVE